MTELTIGTDHFKILPVKPRRSFPLQARLSPIIAELAMTYFRIERLAAPKKKEGEPEGDPNQLEIPEVAADAEKADEKEDKSLYSKIGILFATEGDDIMPHLVRLFSSVSYDDLAFFMRELLSETFCNGDRLFADGPSGKDNFDRLMVGKTMTTWRIMWEAIKVTYPDFLAPLQGIAAKAGAALSAK